MLDTARISLLAFYQYRCRQRDRAKRLLEIREQQVRAALDQLREREQELTEDRIYDVEQRAGEIVARRHAELERAQREHEARLAAVMTRKGVTR